MLFFIWDQTRISRADISKKIPPGITQRQRLFISWGVYFSLSRNINNLLFLRYWRIVTHQGKGQSSAMNHVMSGLCPSDWSHLHSIMMSCVLGAWDFTSPCFTHFLSITLLFTKTILWSKILCIFANCSSVWFVWFEYRDSLLRSWWHFTTWRSQR